MTCGTVAAIGPIRPSPTFTMELFDPQRERSIRHSYTLRILPEVACLGDMAFIDPHNRNAMLPTLPELQTALNKGDTTSVKLTQSALDSIQTQDGQRARVYATG